MRVVFMGTPETAVLPMENILSHSYEISAVFTQPDRPSGRGHKRNPSAVKIFAQGKGLTLFQPEKIRDVENRKILEDLCPDFIVVAAYGQILPEWILKIAKLAPLNIHFSLLPRYRGAAPVAKSILNGDSVTGVTVMVMKETLDSGPILKQRECPIPFTATTGEIEAKLSDIGSELLVEAMDDYARNTVLPVCQDEGKVTWASRISKEDARIDWNENAVQIHNRIRAMNPRPGAYTFCSGQRIHIWSCLPENNQSEITHSPGTFLGLAQDSLRIQSGGGSVLQVRELQKPSKRRTSGREFANGVRLHACDMLFNVK